MGDSGESNLKTLFAKKGDTNFSTDFEELHFSPETFSLLKILFATKDDTNFSTDFELFFSTETFYLLRTLFAT